MFRLRRQTEDPTPVQPRALRRGRGAWLVLSVPIVLIVMWLALSGTVERLDRVLQDALIRLQTRDVSSSPVLIVAIDDKSIAALGQWPWTRGLHASLLDRIASGQPKAIGLDMLLLEPSGNPAADQALADSLRRSGKVALPMLMQNIGGRAQATYPLAPFADAAAALAHVHLDIDNDGVARAVYLREGLDTRQWPHLALALLRIGRGENTRATPTAEAAEAAQATAAGAGTRQVRDPVLRDVLEWRRSERTVIPYAGPPYHFTYVSYVDVLQGRVDPAIFRDRYVLIGAAAAGVGDLYATPVSGQSELMPGVEVTANVLDALLGRTSITPLPPMANATLNAALTVAALLCLAFLGPFFALLTTLLLVAALPLASAIALIGFRVQFMPAAGMIGILLAYVLWSGWRLNTATRYLVHEFKTLRDGTGIGQWASSPMPKPRGDFLERRIQALDQATEHLRDLYRLLNDSIESLPDATVACDLTGRVLLVNQRASLLLGQPPAHLVRQSLPLLLQDIRHGAERLPVVTLSQLAKARPLPAIEARDTQGRDLLIKFAPSHDAAGRHTGWLLSLIDITDIKRVQQQRNEAIRFLGHDIRAPQTAILALLDLRRNHPDSIPGERFEARVERHAQRTLKLSDDFIHLLRAQSHDFQLQPQNLADILDECMDDAWETASNRQIRVRTGDHSASMAYAQVDREMLARALGNLIGNAVKFSPPASAVLCRIAAATREEPDDSWEITIQDQGQGIAPELQADLFEPFTRGNQGSRTEGAGLGLAFVKTVAERHGGQVALRSSQGQGTVFSLILPALTAQELQDLRVD